MCFFFLFYICNFLVVDFGYIVFLKVYFILLDVIEVKGNGNKVEWMVFSIFYFLCKYYVYIGLLLNINLFLFLICYIILYLIGIRLLYFFFFESYIFKLYKYINVILFILFSLFLIFIFIYNLG